MDAFATFGGQDGREPPFHDHTHLHHVIDSIEHGDAPWECITACYQGQVPDENAPWWMTQDYEIWCRNTHTATCNMLKNPAFKDDFHTAAYQEFDAKNERVYSHLMLANWAWRHSVSIRTQYLSNPSFSHSHHRIRLQRPLRTTGQCSALSFWVATRQRY